MAVIAVLGTLDSKGAEHGYVAERIRAAGHRPLLIDVGSGGPPGIAPDIGREAVAAEAGVDFAALAARQDRGECVALMAEASAILLARLAREGAIQGVISLGGGGGTAIASSAMRALPIGFPKLIVSTVAAGNTAHYLGVKDIVLMPSIVDIAGLNRLSRLLFAQAAAAICAMAETRVTEDGQRPLVVASMFGNTTPCVTEARRILEEAGYEVLVFAATGNGGRAMEAMIDSGMVSGVLDLTTTEWADELVGGTLGAGPERLDAAARAGLPVVLAPGCLDMVNFGEPHTVPEKFAGRKFYQHNPQVTLLRTNVEESGELGRILARKANAYGSNGWIFLPLQGLSQIGAPGGPFHDPEADEALFASLRENAVVPVTELDEEINSPVFARACAAALLEMMGD